MDPSRAIESAFAMPFDELREILTESLDMAADFVARSALVYDGHGSQRAFVFAVFSIDLPEEDLARIEEALRTDDRDLGKTDVTGLVDGFGRWMDEVRDAAPMATDRELVGTIMGVVGLASQAALAHLPSGATSRPMAVADELAALARQLDKVRTSLWGLSDAAAAALVNFDGGRSVQLEEVLLAADFPPHIAGAIAVAEQDLGFESRVDMLRWRRSAAEAFRSLLAFTASEAAERAVALGAEAAVGVDAEQGEDTEGDASAAETVAQEAFNQLLGRLRVADDDPRSQRAPLARSLEVLADAAALAESEIRTGQTGGAATRTPEARDEFFDAAHDALVGLLMGDEVHSTSARFGRDPAKTRPINERAEGLVTGLATLLRFEVTGSPVKDARKAIAKRRGTTSG